MSHDSFPFRSDEHAEEEMYREYTGERDFEREMLMASRRRMEKPWISSQPLPLDEWSEY